MRDRGEVVAVSKPVELSLLQREEFAAEYMRSVYTRENFPFTYRAEDVSLDTSRKHFDQEVWNYYWMHCAIPEIVAEKKEKEVSPWQIASTMCILLASVYGICFIVKGMLSFLQYCKKGIQWVLLQ